MNTAFDGNAQAANIHGGAKFSYEEPGGFNMTDKSSSRNAPQGESLAVSETVAHGPSHYQVERDDAYLEIADLKRQLSEAQNNLSAALFQLDEAARSATGTPCGLCGADIAPRVEAGAQTDAARYAWIRESVASHLLNYILRGWRGGMGNYDPDTPPDLIHEWNERTRNELDAEIDAMRLRMKPSKED